MPLCAEIHGSLASQDASAGVQAARSYLLAQARHGVDQVERGPDRAFRVVLVGNGCSPHRHHGIADELLDRPAISLDERPGDLEVCGEELADLLGVPGLGQRSEPHQIRKQDRDEATLRHGFDRGVGHRCA